MSELLSEPHVVRLGEAFFHALWQITLVAILTWCGLAGLRSRTPQVRYAVACGGLLLSAMVPVITYALSWKSAGAAFTPTLQPIMQGSSLGIFVTWGHAAAVPWYRQLHTQLMPWFPWLAMVWAVGFLAMLGRLGGSLWWVERYFRRDTQEAPTSLSERFHTLAWGAGLRILPQLRIGKHATTPMVLGWWRPLVLVPASALLHLSPEALEAVLAHELAHIRRRDPLVNLLQSLVEALLFFHPAAWWLSHQIRELREVCCDDDAVALTGDPMRLARALAALERLRLPLATSPEPALAAGKGPLLARIQRLFMPQTRTLPDFKGLGVAVLLLVTGLCTLAKAGPTPQAHPMSQGAMPTFMPHLPLSTQTTDELGSPVASDKDDQTQGLSASPRGIISLQFKGDFDAFAKYISKQVNVAVVYTEDVGKTPVSADFFNTPWDQVFDRVCVQHGLARMVEEDGRIWVVRPDAHGGDQAPQPMHEETVVDHVPVRSFGAPKPSQAEALDVGIDQIEVSQRPDAPPYPPLAKLAGIEGVVLLEVLLGKDGRPEAIEAVAGPMELRSAAEAHALQWRFRPIKTNGIPVRARFSLTMPFRLAPTFPALPEIPMEQLQVVSKPAAPPYPLLARLGKIQGSVLVEATVHTDGEVLKVHALEGPYELRQVAMDYLKGFRFSPVLKDGQPVAFRVKVTIPFRLV